MEICDPKIAFADLRTYVFQLRICMPDEGPQKGRDT
jgi:hypothetical protein